jgi:hypothetical protein
VTAVPVIILAFMIVLLHFIYVPVSGCYVHIICAIP